MNRVIVLVSGGQDSATLLAYVVQRVTDAVNVLALSFDYGQKNKIELLFAKKLADEFKVQHRVVPINSSFLNSCALVSGNGSLSDVSKKVPDFIVPNRNLLFLTIAHSIAVLEDYKRIYFAAI